MPSPSPLRYPGGKAAMSAYLAQIVRKQHSNLGLEVWFEPFAGGLGAGLSLLASDVVGEVWLCEKHPALAAIWQAIITDAHGFAKRIRATTPSVETFYAARELATTADARTDADLIDLALAGFIVNRCGYSGRIAANVGPIGGRNQSGRYTVAARFNPDRLADRVAALARLAPRMRFVGTDAATALAELDGSVGIEDEVLAFIDPPYSDVGNRLYDDGMTLDQHRALADVLNAAPFRWLATYDATPVIEREWYAQRRVAQYAWRHSANTHHADTEYLIVSDNLDIDPALMPTIYGGRWLPRHH